MFSWVSHVPCLRVAEHMFDCVWYFTHTYTHTHVHNNNTRNQFHLSSKTISTHKWVSERTISNESEISWIEISIYLKSNTLHHICPFSNRQSKVTHKHLFKQCTDRGAAHSIRLCKYVAGHKCVLISIIVAIYFYIKRNLFFESIFFLFSAWITRGNDLSARNSYSIHMLTRTYT